MVLQVILANILLIGRIFPRPAGLGKILGNSVVKYPRVLSVKPSNNVYLLFSANKGYIVLSCEKHQTNLFFAKSQNSRN